MSINRLRRFLVRLSTSGYLGSAVGVISNRFAQVLIQITLARLLTGTDYSLFFFYYAAVTGLSVFVGDAVGLASSRLISARHASDPDTKNTAIAAGFFSSLLAGLFLIIHTNLLSNQPISITLTALLVFYAINLSFSSVLQYITISLNQRDYLAKIQVSFAILSIVSATWAAIYHGWEAALGCLLISVFFSNFFLLSKSFEIGRVFRSLRNRSSAVFALIRSALPIGGSMVLGAPVHVFCLSLLKAASVDRPSELGAFGLSFVAYTLVSFLPGAFGQFLVPWLLKNEKLTAGQAFRYITKLYAAAGIFILFVIVSANFFGLEKLVPNLAQAKNTIYILSVTGFIAGFIALYSFFLNAIYKSNFVLISSVYHSISYILLTYLFVVHLKWGAPGLAFSIFLSSSGQLIILSFIKRTTEREPCI